jgi:hypothetical protein
VLLRENDQSDTPVLVTRPTHPTDLAVPDIGQCQLCGHKAQDRASDAPARLDEQESAHPQELEGPRNVSEKRGHVVLVNTHPIDVSCRAQVTFDEEEIGI